MDDKCHEECLIQQRLEYRKMCLDSYPLEVLMLPGHGVDLIVPHTDIKALL